MRWILTALLCLSCLPTHAAPWVWTADEQTQIGALIKSGRTVKQGFRIEGQHWVVITDVSPRFSAEATLYMDLFSKAFTSAIKARCLVKTKPTLRVFRFYNDFVKRAGLADQGLFRCRWTKDGRWPELHVYTYLGDDESAKFTTFHHRILLHEGTHALMRRYLGPVNAPPWWEEGFATVFETWDLRQSTAENLKHRSHRSRFRERVRRLAHGPNPALPSLSWLLSIPTKLWNCDDNGGKTQRYYAFAEQFVDFLLKHPQGLKALPLIFTRLKRRKAPAELVPKELVSKLEPLWHDHIRRTTKKARKP